MNEPVYDNDYYLVILDEDPHVIDGEPMNWLVIHKLHNTIEASVGPLPNAMLLADQFSIILTQRNKPAPDETLN